MFLLSTCALVDHLEKARLPIQILYDQGARNLMAVKDYLVEWTDRATEKAIISQVPFLKKYFAVWHKERNLIEYSTKCTQLNYFAEIFFLGAYLES